MVEHTLQIVLIIIQHYIFQLKMSENQGIGLGIKETKRNHEIHWKFPLFHAMDYSLFPSK